jgi:lycopene beta-cyclase
VSSGVVIVGGGLAGGITALALRYLRPGCEVQIFEKEPAFGSGHTWSFHEFDLDRALRQINNPDLQETLKKTILSLCTKTWSSYEVDFGDYRRLFKSRYCSIRSEDFHLRLNSLLPPSTIRLQSAVQEITSEGIKLVDGTQVQADLVLDARGFLEPPSDCAFQKFVGVFIKTTKPHNLSHVRLMDASVPQLDGFRFIYVLPWDEHSLLVEDTRYSDTSDVNLDSYQTEIRHYITSQGWEISSVEGIETAALPIPLLSKPEPERSAVARIGVAAGLFHPTTGYSFVEAVRFAVWLGLQPSLTDAGVAERIKNYSSQRWRKGHYLRRLNNMMFKAAGPSERRNIMAKFYRRSETLIARFYANELSLFDQMALVAGRPPVPLWQGVKAFVR